MDAPVFLIHHDPAGCQTYLPLEAYDTPSTFYLPNVPTSNLSVTRVKDAEHSSVRLDVEQDYCLLSAYPNGPAPCIILNDCEIKVPISTATHQKSIIITEDHQFTTPASRWEIEYAGFGEVSESMYPPPSPMDEEMGGVARYIELVSSMAGDALVDRYRSENAREEQSAPIPVMEIQLSPPSSVSPDQELQSEIGRIELLSSAATHMDVMHLNNAGVEEVIAINTGQKTAATLQGSENSDTTSSDQQTSISGIDINPVLTTGYSMDNMIDAESRKSTSVPTITRSEQESGETQNQMELRINTGSTHQATALSDTRNTNPRVKDGTLTRTIVTPSDDVLIPSAVEVEDEEFASEDESQQQKDVRIPKRRLYDIEYEQSPSRSKKQKTKATEDRPTKTNHTVRFEESYDTITVNTVTTYTSPTVLDSVKSSIKPSKKKSRLIPKPNAPAKLELHVSKHVSASTSTPRRSSRQKSETPSSITSAPVIGPDYGRPNVIFGSTSRIPADRKMMTMIEKLGGTVVTDIHDADVLCIGNGILKKTSKFVIAIATGRDIVTDDWIKQAYTDQRFPDRKQFMPTDPQREKEWDFSLSEALKRGRSKTGLRLLENIHVYMTAQLRTDLGNLNKELKQVALALGAASVHAGVPKKNVGHRVLVIGSTKNIDPEAAKVNRLGHKLYGQDVLTMGALRGRINLDSEEFVIQVPVKPEPGSP